MNSDDEELKKCIEIVRTDYKRYFWTVYITLGFKDFLENNLESCRFVFVEKVLNIINNNKVANPDFILQYNNNQNGILCEIKSSVTYDDKKLKDKLYPQLEKYCKDMIGWDTPNNKINNHDLLCIFNAIDVTRVKNLIIDSINKGELNINKNLCMAEYSEMISPKYGNNDIILVKYEYGNLGCKELEEQLKNNLEFPIDELSLMYDRIKFTRNKPPIQYLMELLWFFIFRIFTDGKEVNEVEVTLEQLLVQVYNYYIPWSKIEGEYSQVRKTWIKEAMDMFVKIELAEILTDNPFKYKIYIGKTGLPNNMREYIFEKTCELDLKIDEKKKIDEKQTKINNYNKK